VNAVGLEQVQAIRESFEQERIFETRAAGPSQPVDLVPFLLDKDSRIAWTCSSPTAFTRTAGQGLMLDNVWPRLQPMLRRPAA